MTLPVKLKMVSFPLACDYDGYVTEWSQEEPILWENYKGCYHATLDSKENVMSSSRGVSHTISSRNLNIQAIDDELMTLAQYLTEIVLPPVFKKHYHTI